MSSIEKYSDAYMYFLTQKLHKKGIVTSCLSCDHFIHEGEICGLVGESPPLEIKVKACPKWRSKLPF